MTDPIDPNAAAAAAATIAGAPPMAGMPGPGPESPGAAPAPAASPPMAPPANQNVGMNFVLDVPVEVTIELGRRNMRIAEVLKLGPGSTLELDKVSGDPLDIYVNNQLIARGEAVVIGERYGVRLTDVLVSNLEGAQ